MSKKENLIGKKVDAVKYVEEKGYPEVGAFEDKKALQKFYKQLPTEILEDWCAIEGLEFTPCGDSEPIHRMRVAMAILYKHYPKETKGKKKSKYADYTLEDLIQMAVDNDVAIEVTEDNRILRMRAIMALRDAGLIG